MRYWTSTTSRPSTESICARPTSLKARSRLRHQDSAIARPPTEAASLTQCLGISSEYVALLAVRGIVIELAPAKRQLVSTILSCRLGRKLYRPLAALVHLSQIVRIGTKHENKL
jgi:hypothetical protein